MKSPSKAPIVSSLVGQHFHSVSKEHGKIEWQGTVIGNPEPGWYYLQLFEWLGGTPNVCRLVRIEQMADWLFYETQEDLIYAWEHGIARPGSRYQEK